MHPLTLFVGFLAFLLTGSDASVLPERSLDKRNWSPWTQIGNAIFNGRPIIESWGPLHLEAFGRGLDSALYHNRWDNGWKG